MATLAAGELETFVIADGEVRRLHLHVPDIHCAGCIRKIETAVRGLPGVRKARVNFTTRRLTAEWQPGAVQPAAIVAAVEGAGFAARPFASADVAATQADPQARRLLTSLAVAGFAAMNIMLLSVSVWAGADAPTRNLFHLLSAAIALPAIAYAGRPFFTSAWAALRQRTTNMDVPISIGVLLATALSVAETFRGGDHAYFDAATMLLFFLLVGRYLDNLMRGRARAGVAALLKQSARGAQVRMADGSCEYRPIDCVAPGMTVLVAAGARVPVDGRVTEGASAIDCSLVTGESLPQAVAIGADVLAGTLNLDAPIAVRTTRVGEASFLAEVVRLMEAAEQGRARHMRLADRAARLYAPFVHTAALLTFLGWWWLGAGWQQAMVTGIAVLIITCPCALGLAVPAVQVRAASVLMRHGILVKDGSALERLVGVSDVVFDKTGTLTLGQPAPLLPLALADAELALAAGLAAHSTHPLSRALLRHAAARGIVPVRLRAVREQPGLGLEAMHDGLRLRLGRPDWVGAAAVDAPLQLAFAAGARVATLGFADPLRSDARAVIAGLQAAGLRVHILSGDRAAAVADVARALGVAAWQGDLLPADKLAAIAAMRAEGRRVLVVGDGLNDAPMLAGGTVSMAPATASDAGQTAADLLFLHAGLVAVPTALRLAAQAGQHVRQNFAFAIFYNLLAVPVAIAGLVTPLIAAIAMSGSSIVVVANALRLGLRQRA